MTALPPYPPHDRHDLDVQIGRVITALRKLPEATRVRLPASVLRAIGRFYQMEHENDQWRAAKRAEALATPVHYLARIGDKKTICGLRSEVTPTGWVGHDNENVISRIERGGAICPECSAGIDLTEKLVP